MCGSVRQVAPGIVAWEAGTVSVGLLASSATDWAGENAPPALFTAVLKDAKGDGDRGLVGDAWLLKGRSAHRAPPFGHAGMLTSRWAFSMCVIAW